MTTRLRHVAAVNPPTPEFDRLPDEAAVSFLPLEAIWPGGDLDTSRRRPRHEVSVGYTRFREGDVLLPKITPTFQADRTVVVSGLEGGIGAGTTELHIVRVAPAADARYIRYLLSSKPFLDEGEASMFGVAGQKRVPDSCVRDLVVPVAERPRQRAIADYLDAETARIDALIDNKRRMVELLEERFLEEVRFRVTGGLLVRDPLHVRMAEVGKVGWKPVKLGSNLRFGSGTTPTAGDQRYYSDGSVPWLVTGELRDRPVTGVTGMTG